MKVTIDLGSVDLSVMTNAELRGMAFNILEELTLRAASAKGITQPMIELCRQGKRIAAIKLYREHNGTGLKESKAAIDAACPPGDGFPATYT